MKSKVLNMLKTIQNNEEPQNPENGVDVPIRNLLKNITATVEENINKRKSRLAIESESFLFCFYRGNVTTVKITPEEGLSYREGAVIFGSDYKGNYLLCNDMNAGEAVWYNGNLVTVGNKYYLINNDVITLQELHPQNSMFFLYCIQNERETLWNYDKSTELFEKNAEEKFFFNPKDDTDTMYISRSPKREYTILHPYEGGVIDGQHFLYDGLKLYIQEKPTFEQQKCYSLLSKSLSPEDQLKINIVERVVSEGKNKQKKLLENINLDINTGEMVLVLGGSGAGKTTFLNAVMGKEKANATIMIGEHNLYQDFFSVQRMIGFVPQTETLRPSDTVYMTLKTAAQLKLPKEISADESLFEDLIKNVLIKLGIEKEADNLVSKLSGGQRKRLSVATEYIAEPAVFFLDEPDSGLDGNQAEILMRNLRDIADDNKIVVVISHAPDRAKELYDKVIVLAKSAEDNCGRLAYYGSPNDALEFFGTDTLEHIVRCIETEPDFYIKKYAETQFGISE